MHWRPSARRISILVIAAAVPLRAAPAQTRENRENVKAREEYHRFQRAYPNVDIPASGLERMLRWRMGSAATLARPGVRQASAVPAITADVLAAGAQWSPLGPWGLMNERQVYNTVAQPDAGRVTDVAFVPGDQQTFYVGSAGGGVWKTTSGGATWSPLTDDQCSLNIGAVATDPRAPDIVYAGTGELNTYTLSCGVLRSTDGGSSWQTFGMAEMGPEPGGKLAATGALYVDPETAGSTTGTIVLDATTRGVFRSDNSGQTWTSVYPGWTASLAGSPSDPNVLYAGASVRGVIRSADKGLTWSTLPLPDGLAANQIERIQLATSAAAPDQLWMAVGDFNYKLVGVWRWNDTNQQWTKLGADGLYTGQPRGDFGDQASYDLVLAIDPGDASRVYVGGVRLFRSADGGDHFTQIANDIHVDWHAFRFDPTDPRHIIGGSDGGVFVSTDGGDSWLSRGEGLAIAQFYQGISLHPVLHSLVLGGLQDNGTVYTQGLPLWEGLNDGDGGFTAVDPTGTVFWFEAEWSTDGPAVARLSLADGWRAVNYGIDFGDRAAFLPPLVMHPMRSNVVYFGTQRLYRTTDEVRWLQISASTDLTKGSGDITRIAFAHSDPDTMYIGTSDGLVRMSPDSGITFADAGTGFPNRYVTGIAVDPTNAAHVFATVSGFGTPHLWESTDAGATWNALGAESLPDAPTNVVTLIPGTTGIVVGSDLGVWVSPDAGVTWQPAPAGLPNVEVDDIVYDAAVKRLVVATFGRGMWTVPVVAPAAVLRGDVDLSGTVDAQDALLVALALVNGDLGETVQGTPVQILPAGDANCNGQLDTGDALVLLRQAVGLTTAGSCAGMLRSVHSSR